jgi:nucleoside-diphosphate-sugar epimerase
VNILLTGASGFLGHILHSALRNNVVYTLGRHNSSITADISVSVTQNLPKCDLVIHAAGKAHVVPRNSQEEDAFFTVNVQGTKNLLNALKKSFLPKNFVFISSVAVYGINEGVLINEEQPLNAMDSYGISKIQAESIIQQWCKEHGIICTILRLPLVVGPNPPGNLGRMINAIKKGYYCNIGGGHARKSMVLANDISKILCTLNLKGGIYNLTDGYHPSINEMAHCIALQIGIKKIINMPYWFAKIIAQMTNLLGQRGPINNNKLTKIVNTLTFDDSKARRELGWLPTPVLKGFKIK